MKIVCDNCSTKYSIADEKVRGKVFKIKCKKCSHIIVVKGQEAGAEPAAPGFDQKETRVFDYSGFEGKEGAREPASDAIWHLVIDREQVGPLTPAEVREKFTRGEVDTETYAWREGFGDWQRLGSIQELESALAGTAAAPAAEAAAPGMFGAAAGAGQDPADLFAGAGNQSEEAPADMFGGGQVSGDAGGVFSSSQPAMAAKAATPAARRPAGGEDLFGGGAAAEPVRGNMTGARSENSVLFSLNNLSALANDAPVASKSSSTAQVASSPGFANNGGSEGSGLIDIRAMAAMTLGSASKRDEPKQVGSIDDLPVFSSNAFAAPSSGVLLPTAMPERNNKMVVMMLAGIGVLLIVAIVLVVMLFKGGNNTPPPIASDTPGERGSPPPSDTPPPSDKPAVVPPGDDKPADQPVARPGDQPVPTKPADQPVKPADKPVVKPRDKPTDKPADKPVTKPPEDKPADKPVDKPADRPSQKCDEVACLVTPDLPCCKKSGSDKPREGVRNTDSSLPDKLDQAAIVDGMKGVAGAVSRCNATYKVAGAFKVKVTVNADGKVTNATAGAPMGGTPTGSCVEKAVRGADFKRAKSGITFNYPYNFR